ncbi:MAG TPA: ribokinase [Planctomycetota bacterium]|nr:ribokinase [Planctomycetota bacterium]
MPSPRIVVVGSSNTDMVVLSEALPGPGETVVGGEFLLAAGGKGANQAVAAARLGADVTFVGCVGDDVFGREALAGLKAEGIHTEHVRVVSDCASGVALIMVDSTGENLISVASGANARLRPEDVEAASDVIAAAQCLLVQLEVPLEAVRRAMELARAAGALTVLNPAPARELPRDLLALTDVLTPNRGELARLLGLKTADRGLLARAGELRDAGVRDLIVTLGDEGALIVSDTPERIPAFRVDAVDAVAAGDVFSGAFAVARTEGKPLSEAVRSACAAAAISVTRKGAQPSVPTRDEVEAFLAERDK